MAEQASARLVFTFPFDERAQEEANARGYLSHVLVEVDGKLYPVVFYDTVRLQQDVNEMARHGKACVADVGMIVMSELTLQGMETAVQQATTEGFFEHLKPIASYESAVESREWPPRRHEPGSHS